MVIEQAKCIRHALDRLNSIFVPAGEVRAVRNDDTAAAAMIVVMPAATS